MRHLYAPSSTSETTAHCQEATSAGSFLISHHYTGFTGQGCDSEEATELAHTGKKILNNPTPQKSPQQQKKHYQTRKKKIQEILPPVKFFCG